jgi:hypothetical protein
MDQMLPSPGIFSIPSIGTPHHHHEEDLILPSALQQQHQIANSGNASQVPVTMGGNIGLGGSSGVISYSSGLGLNSGMTPHSLMAPQTPVKEGNDKSFLKVLSGS